LSNARAAAESDHGFGGGLFLLPQPSATPARATKPQDEKKPAIGICLWLALYYVAFSYVASPDQNL
jgi:hypothetical protein